jgi:hypothetical protein
MQHGHVCPLVLPAASYGQHAYYAGLADGRPRLLGELMLSRAIGDLPYRTVGLKPEPEFSAWRNISLGEFQPILN